MFERFSADANDVILAAQAEASLLQSAEVGTGHLLLGIIRLRRPGLARFVPGPPELLLTRARATVTAPPGAVPPAPPVPYSADAEEAIEHASRLTADAQARTEPEHLLLALLAQREDTAANRSLTVLRADRAALAQWARQSLAAPVTAPPAGPPAASALPGGGDARGAQDGARRAEPLLEPPWSRRIWVFFHPLAWGPSMEGARRSRRPWLLAAAAVSLCYGAWAVVVYRGGQLPEGGQYYWAPRNGWTVALLVTMTLALAPLAYFAGRGLGAVAEGWRVARPVRWCVVALGYVAAGLLPLALITAAALALAAVVFGTRRVTYSLTHLSSAPVSSQMLLLVLVPFGLAIAIFALYAPFWHYSVTAPAIAVWWAATLLQTEIESLESQDADIDELRPLAEKRWLGLLKRRFTAFGTEFVEQVVATGRATTLVLLYQYSGREPLLDEALAITRAAADACLRNPGKARDYFHADTALAGLADTLWAIYQIRPDEDALRDAIWAREQLVDSWYLMISAKDRLGNADKLARLQTELYELTGDQQDLDRGLTYARWAARPAGRGDGLAARLLTLGLAEGLLLDARLDKSLAGTAASGEPDDAALSALRAAEAAYRAGAARTAKDEEDDVAECRYRLAKLLAHKARLTSDARHRDEALRLLRDLVGEDPARALATSRDEGPPERWARFMTGLADVLADGPGAAAQDAVTWYKAAAEIAEAAAVTSLEAACGWGYHAADPVDAAAGLERAVELLTLAAVPGLGYDATRRRLGRWAELPVDAAAAQLRIDRPERAVELLEHGRTVMWSRRTDLWNVPLDEIGADQPQLRDRLRAIRAELLASSVGTAGRRQQPGQGNMAAERRAALYGELNRRLRELGLGRPAPFAELKAAADQGPVVVLNVSRLRSDALILRDGVPMGRVPLAGDVHAKARAVIEEGTEGPSVTSPMLSGWLWSDVAKPVLGWLNAHGALKGDGDGLPRLWWCPTGWLTFLPLHAAGSGDSPHDSVMDQVVSSYTPSLAQLIRARALVPEESRQVVILAPALRPDSDLPAVQAEAGMVAEHFPASHVILDENADKESCLRAIGDAAVLHFAGHGQAPEFQRGRRGSPSPGGLVIGRPGAYDFLSPRELADLRQARARFAYLSACVTATPDNLVPDEATHPAAVLHFGGFPHVIATLYPVNDYFGQRIATGVYNALVRDGLLDEGRSARVLHDALRALLREQPSASATCAAFMHFGP